MPARTRTASTKAGACASPARWAGLRVALAAWAGPGAAGWDTLDSVALLYPQHHTTGINCERCLPGFYRDPDQPLDSPHTCRREWGQPGWSVLETGGWEQGSPGSLAPCLPGALPPLQVARSQLSSHCPD